MRTDDATLATVVEYVEEQRIRLGIPGMAVAIVVGDEVRVVEGLGVTSDGDAIKPDTVFLVNSLSKSITAFALIKLVESGLVDLDSPVSAYIPELAPDGDQVSVRDVMHHRSGISDELPARDQHDLESNIALGPHLRSNAAYWYTNANYDLLALLVERVSGLSFADYVEENIFDPLGMNRSSVGTDRAQRFGPADGHYRWLFLGYQPLEIPVDHGQVGSAAMYSTAIDMARYLIAHLNGGAYRTSQLLSEEGVETLHEAHPYTDEFLSGYGGGLHVDPANASDTPIAFAPRKTVWHDGASETFRSVMWMTLGPDIGMVILANGNDAIDGSWIGQLSYRTRLLLSGEEPPDMANQADFLIRWSKHLYLALLLLQIVFVLLVIPPLRGLRNGDPPSTRQWVTLGAATLIDIAAAFLVLMVTPAVSNEPLSRTMELPDYRILLTAILLGVLWGIIRTILLALWLARPKRQNTPDKLQTTRT